MLTVNYNENKYNGLKFSGKKKSNQIISIVLFEPPIRFGSNSRQNLSTRLPDTKRISPEILFKVIEPRRAELARRVMLGEELSASEGNELTVYNRYVADLFQKPLPESNKVKQAIQEGKLLLERLKNV